MGCFSRQHAREYVLQKGEINSTDVSLGYVANDLLLFFYEFTKLDNAKKEIEKKYGIELQEHNCWTEDDIKKAWKETKRMGTNSRRRRHCSVIMLQIVKRFVCDTCKQNAAQKNRDATTVEQGCETTPNSEDRIIQSKAELETAGAAGGVEQMLGEENKLSKVSRPTESDSGVASGSPLSASSTDEAPSPAEVNSRSSETKNAGLLNEDEDTDNDNDQRKDVDDYDELYVKGMYDPENEIWEDVLCSTDDTNQACGKAESIKGNSEDKSPQDSDEPNTDPAETVTQRSGRKRSKSTDCEQTKQTKIGTGTQFPSGSQNIANDDDVVTSQSGADSAAPNDVRMMDIDDEYNYICIPLSNFDKKTTESSDANTNTDTNSDYTYQLIDESPICEKFIIRPKESYVMLYDTDTKNAKWVYEILNKSTVPYPYKKQTFKKDNMIVDVEQALESTNGFKHEDYVRGHLAAAANHVWCQEAYKDTYLISNMTPQIKSINNGIWKKLEFYCRKQINKDEVRNVHVYTGPLYQNNDEGSTMKGKAVPTHYFKVVIMENENGKAKVECYVVENKKKESETTDNLPKKREKINLRDYSSTIKKIETMSGLTFTHKEGDNNRRIVKKTLTCTGENESKHATIVVNIST